MRCNLEPESLGGVHPDGVVAGDGDVGALARWGGWYSGGYGRWYSGAVGGTVGDVVGGGGWEVRGAGTVGGTVGGTAIR